MSAKPKPQSTEVDHIRDTLTDVVNVVGETRQDIKKLDNKIDAYQQENRERFDQQDKRFDQQDKRFDQQDKRFDQIEQKFDTRLDQLELLIRQRLPNANN